MRFIPTRTHGIVDYVLGLVLIIAPWILDFADGGAEQWVPIIIGAIIIVQSLMTDYELGVVKVLPMSTHLTMDIVTGAVLAVSPWVFGFADDIWWPHLVLGLLEIGAALTTQTRPAYEGTSGAHEGGTV